ncbi:unnamed protein product [Parnassius apollo]|uniref:(apollo) hypothetical protein n=1 Tax=Parnassius apollo TaxID=110799 RepID=A0A8S3Y857_PARAO|nr:unnamed protein product [Parnassius apollo]
MSVQKIVKYICGNVQFDISATDDIHHKLQTDDQFASHYFENLIQQHNTPETADEETEHVANNLIGDANNESEEDNVIESSTSQINPLPLNLSKSNKRFENIFSDADTIDSTSSHSLAVSTADENIEKQVKKDAGKNTHARQLYGQRNKQLQLDIEKKEIFKQMAKNSEDNNNILSNNAYIWKNTMDNLIIVLKEKNAIMKERNDIFSDISNKLDGP